MSRGSKLCKREKNKWRQYLEQVFEDERISKRARELEEEQRMIEEQYPCDIWRDGIFDDYDYCEDDFDYEEWDRYESSWLYDDDWHLDSRTYADNFSPGCHVQNGRDVYLVLETKHFANLRTGEVVRWLDHAEIIWGD